MVEYEGEVELACQEGGFASPAIILCEVTGTGARDATGKWALMAGLGGGLGLDEMLRDKFAVSEDHRSGDVKLGCLRIVVERVETPEADR